MKNFIPINRNLFNHYLWKESRKYSKFEAWLDILQLVSFAKNNQNMINGLVCKWGRGQYPVSISFLCERWSWTEKPVRNYLKMLEGDKMIELKKASKWTMLTVCKYDSYNKGGQAEDQPEGNQGASRGQQLKRVNKEKKEIISEWLIYRKQIKKEVTAETTLEKLIDKFNKEPLDKCVWVVNNSIENSYQGLFWDNYKGGSNGKIVSKTQLPII